MGFTVAVTAARRADEFIALLQRHGATTVHAPAIRIVHLAEDEELRRVTAKLIAEPPDVLVATTAIGFRSWIDAAHAWGLAEDLLEALDGMHLVARGPKAVGAIRQAGLCEQGSPQSESSHEVVEQLVARGARGVRVAVQLHGAGSDWEPNADVCRALSAAGARVLKVPVYRWEQPEDAGPMNSLIASVISGGVDAVTFTSAPAVASMLQRAERLGVLDGLVGALRASVMVACVGPVTASALDRVEVPAVTPSRYRLGALARLILQDLPRRERRLHAGGRQLGVRGTGVRVDGQWRPVPPGSMVILRRLIADAGNVVSTHDLLRALPGGQRNPHVIHSAVARLRASLGAPVVIETVTKRGYRLDVRAVSAPSTDLLNEP